MEMAWHVTLGVAILLDFVGSHQEIIGNPEMTRISCGNVQGFFWQTQP
jgi:hypothetical protein